MKEGEVELGYLGGVAGHDTFALGFQSTKKSFNAVFVGIGCEKRLSMKREAGPCLLPNINGLGREWSVKSSRCGSGRHIQVVPGSNEDDLPLRFSTGGFRGDCKGE